MTGIRRSIRQLGRAKLVAMLGATTFAMWASVASADTINFDLTSGNSAISGFTGPYAHLVVDRTSSTMATLTFTVSAQRTRLDESWG